MNQSSASCLMSVALFVADFICSSGPFWLKMTFVKRNQSWLSAEMAPPARRGQLEEEGYAFGFNCIAGLDEVGRGPWAGPVAAAAVILPRDVSHPDIRDSKLLTSKKREEMAAWIKERAVAWGLGIVGPEEIDRINILEASLLAMACAFKQLHPTPDCLLIDGLHKIPLEFLKAEDRRQKVTDNRYDMEEGDGAFIPQASCLVPGFPVQRAIKKGDRLCVSIGAASIVAKVARDEIMENYDTLYPEYGFRQNKGYGSSMHLAALNRHGPSPIHRRSFKPVRECLRGGISSQQSAFNLKNKS